MKIKNTRTAIPILAIFLFCFLTPFSWAQSERSIRIIWSGGENALHYLVELDKMERGVYQNYLRETTTSLFLSVSLAPGEYRYRVFAYDILGRPGEGSSWIFFVVSPPIVYDSYAEADEFEKADTTETVPETQPAGQDDFYAQTDADSQEQSDTADRRAWFNTIGASLGTSFIDPVIIATIHGTYSPIRNFFIEPGLEIGFISIYSDVEKFYCIYPFVNLGYFMPFREKGGLFAGTGAGYMTGSYTFSYGSADINTFAVNIFAGVNLFDMLNISYTVRTNFKRASNKLAIGYVYRF
ncbi:MAG: hypothetical protein FWD40_11400 [Treponema sp.]|nr:hypothetical protein [Treponema sp.]